jgi:hypothetical protein
MVAPYLGFNCQSCQAIEGLAEENGCRAAATVGRHEIGSYSSDRCPLGLMRDAPGMMPWLRHIHQTWPLRKSTPDGKAPAVLVEAWDEISHARNAIKEWRRQQPNVEEEVSGDG